MSKHQLRRGAGIAVALFTCLLGVAQQPNARGSTASDQARIKQIVDGYMQPFMTQHRHSGRNRIMHQRAISIPISVGPAPL